MSSGGGSIPPGTAIMRLKAIVTIILVILFGSCSTRKQAVKIEDTAELQKRESNARKDSVFHAFSADTSRECEQVLNFERVEYYPETYVYRNDDSCTYSDGYVCKSADSCTYVRQMVKSVTRYSKQKTEKAKANVEAKSAELHTDTASFAGDINVGSKSESVTKSTHVDSGLWWLIGVVVLLVAGVAYVRYKIID